MYKRKPKQRSKCAHCGELFTHAMPNARYCSGACRIAAFRARKPKQRPPQTGMIGLEAFINRPDLDQILETL